MHSIDGTPGSRALMHSVHLARRAWNYVASLRQSTIDAVIIVIFSVITFSVEYHYDLAPKLFQFATTHKGWEIDNLIFVLLLMSIVFAIFSYRRVKELTVEMKARRSAENEGPPQRRIGGKEARATRSFDRASQPPFFRRNAR